MNFLLVKGYFQKPFSTFHFTPGWAEDCSRRAENEPHYWKLKEVYDPFIFFFEKIKFNAI